MSQRKLATELEFSSGLIGGLENRTREFSDRFINRMRDRYGVSADWLLRGEGDQLVSGVIGFDTRLGPARPPKPKPQAGDIEVGGVDYSFVRRYDVRASAGPGDIVESEDVTGQVALTRQFLLKHGMKADLAGLVEAHGDSMEPLIPNGALMLVSFAVDPLKDNAIYIVRHGDDLLVKRITVSSRDAVGRPLAIALVSENAAYSVTEIEGAGLRDFQAIARVVTVIRDL